MSIRARLALWYGTLLSLLIGTTLAATYVVSGDAPMDVISTDLREAWKVAASQVRSAYSASGSLGAILLADSDDGVALVDAVAHRTLAATRSFPRGLDAVAASIPDGMRSVVTDADRILLLAAPVDGVPGARLVATESLATLDASLARLRTLLLLFGAGGIAIALLGGWAIAENALRPVAVLTATARSIAGSRTFSRRVPEMRRRDELGQLARTFNEMLASLEGAHELQQRFVSDASHELRTPLATLHGNAQLLAQEDAGPAERNEAAALILRETRRLTRLTDDLLSLAHADAGTEPLDAQRVELDEVAMEAFEELRPQAGSRLRVVALEEAPVLGERDRLKQLLLILLDNALRYTPADGTVDVSVAMEDGTAILRADDTGVGIPADVAAHAFDRFYRGEAARRMAPDGTGLGLPIARWIVERHGGTITLEPRRPHGTRAVVRIPAIVDERPRHERRGEVDG